MLPGRRQDGQNGNPIHRDWKDRRFGSVTIFWSFHRADKTVSKPRQRLDPMRSLGRISNRRANTLYRVVESVVEIDKRVCRPKRLLQLFAADQLARTFQQHVQDLKRLARQL